MNRKDKEQAHLKIAMMATTRDELLKASIKELSDDDYRDQRLTEAVKGILQNTPSTAAMVTHVTNPDGPLEDRPLEKNFLATWEQLRTAAQIAEDIEDPFQFYGVITDGINRLRSHNTMMDAFVLALTLSAMGTFREGLTGDAEKEFDTLVDSDEVTQEHAEKVEAWIRDRIQKTQN